MKESGLSWFHRHCALCVLAFSCVLVFPGLRMAWKLFSGSSPRVDQNFQELQSSVKKEKRIKQKRKPSATKTALRYICQ